MIQRVLELVSGPVDVKFLVAIMITLVAIMFVCGVVSIATLDRDNYEIRMILEGLLKEKTGCGREEKGLSKMTKLVKFVIKFEAI